MRISPRPAPAATDLQRAVGACRTSLLIVFAFSCGYNLLLLAPPIYLLQIYDRVLSSRSLETLLMLTLIVGVAVLVGSLLDTIRRAALSRLGAWLEERLRSTVLSATFDCALRGNGGTASEGYRDLTTLRQFIASPSSVVLFDAPWSLLFLGVLFLVHPMLGAIGAIGAAFLFGCALLNDLLTAAPSARAQSAEAGVHARLGVALRHVEVMRAMGMVGGASQVLQRDAAEASEAQETAARRSEIVQAISKSARALTQVMMMGAAAWLVLDQHVSPGVIFAASLLLGRGLGALEGVLAGWKAFGVARGAYKRLTTVLVAAPSREATPRLPQPLGGLLVDNVSFVPPGTTNLVLQGVSFALQPGECLGIIGPSGAGKSTLGRMIAGISTPTMGRIRLDGIEMPLWLDHDGAKHFGYLPQEVELFEGSVRDNIARLGSVDLRSVVEAAKLVGLHESILRLPRGYDTPIGGAAGAYVPGGQRQGIGLARAFFGDPKLVLLDEPNASLDEPAELALHQAVAQRKAAGATIVIITHRLGILDLTDKIAILRGGVVSAFGSSEEIYLRYFKRAELPTDVPEEPRSLAASRSRGRRVSASPPREDVARA